MKIKKIILLGTASASIMLVSYSVAEATAAGQQAALRKLGINPQVSSPPPTSAPAVRDPQLQPQPQPLSNPQQPSPLQISSPQPMAFPAAQDQLVQPRMQSPPKPQPVPELQQQPSPPPILKQSSKLPEPLPEKESQKLSAVKKYMTETERYYANLELKAAQSREDLEKDSNPVPLKKDVNKQKKGFKKFLNWGKDKEEVPQLKPIQPTPANTSKKIENKDLPEPNL